MNPALRGSVAIAAMAAACAAAAPAHAQADGSDAYDAEASTQADPGDEIVVQARRRAESIEDVPASVSVLSDDDLERLSVRDVADYTRQTPGALLISSGPQYLNDIALRGQGGGRLGFSESTTGIYRDGIYVAGGGFGGRSYGDIDFYDVERVEVYRGPQGALYGRSAVGGAVNVISRKPVNQLEVRAKAGYDSVEQLQGSATLNLPIANTVALRFGGFYNDQKQGFYIDQVTGKYLDTEKSWGVRGTLGFGIDTDNTVNLTVEYSDSSAPGFSSLGQNVALDPDPFVRTGLDTTDRVDIAQTQLLFDFTHDFGDSELVVLANYKGRQGDRAGADFDHYSGIRNANIQLIDDQGEDFERYGAEVHWGSTGNGALSWLIGADFQTYESNIYSNRHGTVIGSPAATTTVRRQLRLDNAREDLFSYSAFGLIGYDLTSRINITAEARFQADSKKFRFQRFDLDATTNDAVPLTLFDRDWTRFLPTVSINYEVSDAVTLYGRVATGYRPGGFNQTPVPGFFDRVAYNPEDIAQGELGVKAMFRSGGAVFRGQLAAYYGETRDVQQTTTLSTTNPAFTLENVGDNRIYGAELELSAMVPLGQGRFTASMNASASHGKWKDGASILFQGAVLDLSGKDTPRARDYMITLNGGFTHPLGGGIDGLFTASFQTAGGGFDDASLARASDSYSNVDLSAGIQGKNWRLLGYVKNLTNDIYRVVTVGGNNYYNTPRTWGGSISFDW
ncbi:TonB-dependent receptor [Sphingomonas canadensis]|uniref:TonB-dependent receptor n=1 Tax=Sphingomonas canadensis TaxID=1219257 RepID=A0ABW3H5M0_9SPHN|nr:TonB-dependent receptor [Sphingomonas canadensis]MCW3834445.1 TonB-dependent receptor [Sphingomonas canadensis]